MHHLYAMGDEDKDLLKEKVRALPRCPGVYLMKDQFGGIIYVGKAKNLKNRVSSYFQQGRHKMLSPKIQALISMISDFEYHTVKTETEALLLEGRLIKDFKPKYNTDFTDDKQFVQIRVDLQNKIPKFRIVRNRLNDHAHYFGPYPYGKEAREVLKIIRIKFGIILNDTTPQKTDNNKWKLYNDVRAEIFNHNNYVTEEEYAERVNAAIDFLEGKDKSEIENLKKKMKIASDKFQYEKAAAYRDRIFAMQKLIEKNKRFLRAPLKNPYIDSSTLLTNLQKILEMEIPPTDMECFDISHISGSFVVASCVHFHNALPDKSQYRRFKIKGFIGNDDFQSMNEVVFRRYHRLVIEKKKLPELVVIDGGLGQVHSALLAFNEINPPKLPYIIGLAKKEETIIFAKENKTINLAYNAPELQLLQRLRDEAHRFANSFNIELRSKKIRESILDEIPGIGEKKKNLLLEKYKTISALKNADLKDLAKTPHIGESLAKIILNTLNK